MRHLLIDTHSVRVVVDDSHAHALAERYIVEVKQRDALGADAWIRCPSAVEPHAIQKLFQALEEDSR